jgi:hypothetical protein
MMNVYDMYTARKPEDLQSIGSIWMQIRKRLWTPEGGSQHEDIYLNFHECTKEDLAEFPEGIS